MNNPKETEMEQLWDQNLTIVREGKARILSNRAAPIQNRNGEVTGIVMVLRDITEKCEAEKQIAYLSFNDKLTGLFNRAYIDRIFPDLDSENQLPTSLILADVNGLKLTNDVFGHQIGDELLIEMAGILRACCRGGDLIARWGGDEFVIILPGTPASVSEMICHRIHVACKQKRVLPLEVSCALGTATRSTIGMRLSDVFSLAEDRMYRAKVMGSKAAYHTIIEGVKQKLRERGVDNQGHIDRLKGLARMMADCLELPEMERDKLLLLAEVHDIGKITVPAEILLKQGPLTWKEWEKVKKHCEVGFRLAHTVAELKPISDAILSHHERYNGLGYPQGLKEESIPLLARILAVIDSFDVMTHEQVYKQAVPVETACDELKRVAGTQLDPELVHLFVTQLQGQA
jgi:diguanylate cyclase (GGDEF)-like protein